MRATHRSAKFFAIFLAVGAVSVAATIRNANANPIGTWLIDRGGHERVQIAPCGANICGKLGDSAFILGMGPAAGDKWQGRFIDPANRKVYTGTLTELSGDALRLQGCAMGGLICEAIELSRAE